MKMVDQYISSDSDSVIESMISEATGEIVIQNNNAEFIQSVIRVVDEQLESLENVKLLSRTRDVKDALRGFKTRTTAAECIKHGVLEIKVTDKQTESSVCTVNGTVYSLVITGDQTAAIPVTDTGFVNAVSNSLEQDWENASEYTVRTPAISDIRASLSETVNEEYVTDFNNVFEQVSDVETKAFDEEGLFLTLAGKHGLLLYVISKWGEDTGVASKATFSRTKTRLEERGVLSTEKVPIDVGRPRLRLRLGEEMPENTSAVEIVELVQEVVE